MKGFGKFVTFVGITGAALAGLWYFCEMNKDKCECSCDTDDADAADAGEAGKERSYVSLDPELKEGAEELKENVKDGKETLKKAVKSAAQDIMSKAEDAAKGVGLVKDGKKAGDFEFEDFDKAAKKAKKSAEKAVDEIKDAVSDAASHIDIQ